jgi:molecular chaperone GrpE
MKKENKKVSSENTEDKSEEKKESKKVKVNWEEKATENLAGWQRAKADYENLQKDVSKQREEYVKYANGNLIMELLPIYDNFKIAFKSAPKEEKDNGWLIGLQHIMNQMWSFLENNGVEEIKTLGEKLNTEIHEAVETMKDDGEENIVLKEIKSGYKLNGKVIQCAKVVVSG